MDVGGLGIATIHGATTELYHKSSCWAKIRLYTKLVSWVPPKWMKSNGRKERQKKKILQGLGVVQVSVTELWL